MRRDDPILEVFGYGLPYWIEDTAASCVFNTRSINPSYINAARITYVLYRPRPQQRGPGYLSLTGPVGDKNG